MQQAGYAAAAAAAARDEVLSSKYHTDTECSMHTAWDLSQQQLDTFCIPHSWHEKHKCCTASVIIVLQSWHNKHVAQHTIPVTPTSQAGYIAAAASAAAAAAAPAEEALSNTC
jgi:hypothetical protein